MPNLARRSAMSLVALFAAIGLALMHAGVGQAMACTGSADMAMMPGHSSMQMSTVSDHIPGGDGHSAHHPPADNPIAAHGASMCMARPITDGAGSGFVPAANLPATPVAIVEDGRSCSIPITNSWLPPPPDLISELCVIRQ